MQLQNWVGPLERCMFINVCGKFKWFYETYKNFNVFAINCGYSSRVLPITFKFLCFLVPFIRCHWTPNELSLQFWVQSSTNLQYLLFDFFAWYTKSSHFYDFVLTSGIIAEISVLEMRKTSDNSLKSPPVAKYRRVSISLLDADIAGRNFVSFHERFSFCF